MADAESLAKQARKASHGWFTTPRRPGDRTFEQQIIGLEPLFAEVSGKTVLDVGCAEGLISIECARRGARFTRGAEIVAGHVAIANTLHENRPCKFIRADANEWVPDREYDIVLLLAILHKLTNPTDACARFAGAARELCVIRYPISSEGEVIVDARSSSEPHNIGELMEAMDFRVEQITVGPFDEQTYFYRR